MAQAYTARLIPSSYTLSSTQYLTVTDESNMYANVDSTNYATIQHTRGNTTAYYLYLHNFNFSSIPNDAKVSSFTVKIRAYESGLSTSATYRISLYNNTTSISNTTAAESLSTSVQTLTIPTGSLTWSTLNGYGNNFRIRVPLRRNQSGTACYVYVYGAEIEVNYTVPTPAVVTSTLTGNGVISPSGAYNCYEDDEYTLTITPTTKSDAVTATKNGVDITDQLVPDAVGGTDSRVLGAYSLISGGFNGSGATYFSGLVGAGIDHTKTTSNYYSSSSGTQAVFQYDMGFDLPARAEIQRVWCTVNGHAESTSNANEYMCIQLKSGSTNLSEQFNYKSAGTSNSDHTLECTTIPSVAQLANMVLECTLGYYGGAINGATAYVEYTVSGYPEYYTYTYTVDGNATIAVTIGGSAAQPELYVKQNGAWVKVTAAYIKQGGAWVQTAVDSVFQAGVNYKRG